MTELHHGEVDGVPTYWVETGRPTLAAGLLFRQGLADEEFATSGWTHLLEHMCLHGRGGGALAVNGSVSMLVTTFSAHGPAGAVADHLSAVCSWLGDPDLGSLEHERKILAAESDVRSVGDLQQAFLWRYGARGPGLCAQQEPGLARATPEALRELAATVFTRDNAVLVLDGPPPAGLRLRLPEGEHRPLRPAVQCDGPMPASYTVERGVVLSGAVTRSTAAMFLARSLDLELNERLREQAGAAYAPWTHYEPVDADQALVIGGSDVAPAHHAALTGDTLAIVERLRNPCTPERLDTLVTEYVQAISDPYQAMAIAQRAAHFALRGEEPQTLDEILDEARAITPEQIAKHGEELAATLFVGLPEEAERSYALPELKQQQSEALAGATRYRSANAPADPSELLIAPETIQIVGQHGTVGMAAERVVGLLKLPDGGRRLVDDEGWAFTVEPTMWRNGRSAVAAIDAMVPADRHLPQPEREPAHVPQPASARLRYQHLLRDRRVRVGLLGIVFVGLLVLVHQLIGRVPWGGVAVLTWALVAAWNHDPDD